MNYIYRVVSTGFNSRKMFLYDGNYDNSVDDLINKTPEKAFYESIYLYTEEHKTILEKTGSVGGIRDVKTDRIVFDLDDKENPAAAKADAVTLVARLIQTYNVPVEAIRIYFSGNKGFHVVLHTNELFTRPEFENIVDNVAGDLETFDTTIRDENRIFRIPMTVHNESGKVKIPLTIDELSELSMDKIYEKSLDPDFEAGFSLMNSWVPLAVIPKDFRAFKTIETREEKEKYEDEFIMSDKPDMTRRPRHITSAKFVLQEGFFEDGERNTALMILCTLYRFFGYNQEIAYNMLVGTLRLRNRRLGKKEVEKRDKDAIWHEIITPVYSPNWKGGLYDDEHPLIQKTIERYNLKSEYQEKNVVDIKEVSARFLDFALNIDKNRVRIGVDEIDKNVLITSGMMVGLLGAPSSGKTTHALTFLEHQSINNLGAFFVCADMPDTLCYARLMQRYCGWSVEKILDTMKVTKMTSWPKELKDAWDKVLVNFKNVGFSFQSGPTVEETMIRMEEHEQKTGMAIKVGVFDYLEKFRCNMTDATAASGYNASRLADLIRERQMAGILLLQPQKSAGDPSDELLSMRKVKGASVIEQDCRVILTTWRPGFNPGVNGINPDDKYCSIAVVKNNMGATCQMDFHWDGAYGKIRSLSGAELPDFKRVVENTKRRKAEGMMQADVFTPQVTTARRMPVKPAPTPEPENGDFY